MTPRACSPSCLTVALFALICACAGESPPLDDDATATDEDQSPVDGDDEEPEDVNSGQDESDTSEPDPDDDDLPEESTDPLPDSDGGAGDPDPVDCALDPQRIFDDVAYLASQELRGRIPGDVGNEQALSFAQEQLLAAGLEPGGDDGTYRQPFEFSCGHSWCQNNRSGVAENVIGKIRGSDPVLGDEVIIVGAHIDHLGVDDEGAVYGGADDNASGAAIVLELARMFGRCGLTPKRTLLFVEWNAEEMGLIGSRHYVDNPIESLDRTIAVYNFDMVGGGDGSGILLFGGEDDENRWLTELMRNAAEAEGLNHAIQIVPQKLASDHAPFVERGIPVCWGFARPDPHPGYHTPDDDMSRINMQSLRAVSELFWAALRPLAMGEESTFTITPNAPHVPRAQAGFLSDVQCGAHAR
jgi:hypothetical protein